MAELKIDGWLGTAEAPRPAGLPEPDLADGASLIDAGDRWLASRFAAMSEQDVQKTAAMMVGFLRRIAAPEVTP